MLISFITKPKRREEVEKIKGKRKIKKEKKSKTNEMKNKRMKAKEKAVKKIFLPLPIPKLLFLRVSRIKEIYPWHKNRTNSTVSISKIVILFKKVTSKFPWNELLFDKHRNKYTLQYVYVVKCNIIPNIDC